MTDLSGKKPIELLAIYNAEAERRGLPTVKRFADAKSALKRTQAMLNGEVHSKAPKSGSAKPKKAASAKKPAGAGKKAKRVKPDGEIVRSGSYREKLMAIFEKNKGEQVPISKLMVAVYGESRKDYKGPLMMVMKGLKSVIAANRMGLEIRKTRENKENHFGLHSKK